MFVRIGLMVTLSSVAGFLCAEPPAFKDVLMRMVDVRNQEDTFSVSYMHEKTTNANGGTVTYSGKLYVFPDGFRHERILVDGTSVWEGNQGTLDNQLGKAETVIVTRTHVAQMGLNGPHGMVQAVVSGTTRLTRRPFDPRAFGLGLAGDVRQGWSLERTASNFLDWNDPVSSRWVTKGVVEYYFGDAKFRIDLDRGYWPVSHSLIRRNKDGTTTTKSRAEITLKESDGKYFPSRVELWTDKSYEVYELSWMSKKPSRDLLDFESAAKASNIVLRTR